MYPFIYFLITFFSLLTGFYPSLPAEEISLKDNLKLAKKGDYIVISSNKTQTLMHIYDKQGQSLIIEEVSIPESKRPPLSWKEWMNLHAPHHTLWVMYEMDLNTGQMGRYYSFTKNNWFEIPDADNFLSKLLSLKLNRIPDNARKKVGPKPISGPDWRPMWQPKMVVEGLPIKGIVFDAWRTKWPRDGSELSGKTIEVYTPRESANYPSYFPYWLQINGAVGKAKIRIIDSGFNLHSPKPTLTNISEMKDVINNELNR